VAYTIPVVGTAAAVVAMELVWLRTGLLRRRSFWIAYAICLGFQVLVDGWLTKRTAPIVRYDDGETTGVRFPWDIPVEDYVFGFALIALTLLLWERRRQREAADVSTQRRSVRSGSP
jgi:lycopene cyclase domain-containing protein